MLSNRDKAIKRISALKRHFSPSEDFNREIDGCTFDFDLASKVVDSLRPDVHHQIIALIDSVMEENDYKERSRENSRFRTNILMKKVMSQIYEKGLMTYEDVIDNPDLLNRCTMGISFFGGEISTKFAFHIGLYLKSIKNMGTDAHREDLEKGAKLEEMGCFCLTELGHGSDATKIETTAHYDQMTDEFIFNSPTETSRKFWIGNLASTATKAVVFAQLVVNGVRHGVHGFVFQIRNPETHEPLPGLTIGDCGDKIGLQGVDNGWMIFDNFRVEKKALLNRYASISPDGVYNSKITSNAKRMAIQFSSLSGGRLAIAQVSNDCALGIIAGVLRYWAVRKQFKNPNTKTETRLLDYRINHYRLLTRFARHFVNHVAQTRIIGFWDEYLAGGLNSENKLTGFAHLISSVSKAEYTWYTYHSVSEARQAMGGLGFSAYNGLGNVIPVMDLNRTWEGDNNILMQQAGRLVLKNLSNLLSGKPVMPTFEFLTAEVPEVEPFTKPLNDVVNLLELFTYRATSLIHQAGLKLQFSEDKVEAWDRLLAMDTYPATFAYFDRFLLSTYVDFLENFNADASTKNVFSLLGVVYAQKKILEDLDFFREYLTRDQTEALKEDLMDNLLKLRPEVVGLSYLMPVTDKMIGAVGKLEMKPYEKFLGYVERAQMESPDTDGDIIIQAQSPR